MAELKVGIQADVTGGKKVVRTLKDIRRAANDAAGGLSTASAAAGKASVSLQTTVSASGALATSQNLAATANIAVARTLSAVAVKATQTAASETVATKATNTLTAAFARLGATAKAALTATSARSKALGSQIKQAAATVGGLGTAGVGLGAAIAVGIGTGIKSAVNFEKTMSRIIGLVGVASSEVEGFKKPLLDIAKATAKGPNELAEALFFITSAGAKGQDALDILEASAKAASAGLGETADVADAVTSAVNAYGKENLSAAQSTDILVASVREGKAAADEIAGAIGQVLPIASQLNVTFDQVGATISALTRVGLNAAESATALKATLNAISKPGNEAVSTLKKLSVQNLGVEKTFDDVRKVLREDGLIAALNLLQDATGGNTQELQKIFPNIRAGAGVFSLLGKNAKQVEGIFNRMTDTVGATDDAFEAYKNTTSFELNEALVVLQVSLQKIGEDLLPAVAKAFVTLASAVDTVVGKFESLGEVVARAVSGSDDPIKRMQDDLRKVQKLQDGINASQIVQANVINENGLLELTEVERKNTRIERQLNAQLNEWKGIEILGQKVEGSYTQQQLTLNSIENQLLRNIAQTKKDNALAEERKKGLTEEREIIEEIIEAGDPVSPVDIELLARGQKGLKELRDEVAFLTDDLGNLANEGQAGIGLAGAAAEANSIFEALQGTVQGLSRQDIEELLLQKNRLETAINQVNEAFTRQQQATLFIEDLEQKVRLVANQFEAVRSGGSLLEVQALQQATQLFDDLAGATGKTVEELKQVILLEEAQNRALKALDPTGVQDLLALVTALQTAQASFDPNTTQFAVYQQQIDALNSSLIDTALAAEGLPALDQIILETLPKAEQFALASERLKEAFNLAGVVDPEQNPQFIAAIERLEEKIFNTGDTLKEFAIQAARNLQSAFADFLFDPFSDGLDGLLSNFTETLHRMASELLSQQLLQSFFSSIGGGGGGLFSTVASSLGARANGGPVVAGQDYVVGERGPEVFSPRQSGNIISNETIQQQAAPQVNVAPAPVIVLDDPAKIGRALQSDPDTQRALVDSIGQKKGAINQALS